MSIAREQPVVRFLRTLTVRQHLAVLPDRTLLERFVNTQEQEPFTALVRRHGAMVYRVCRQVLDNEHDAEDAFQAAFLILSRKAASVQKRESVGSWLFGVAHHCATNLRRSRLRRRCHERRASQPMVADLLSTIVVGEAQMILNEELARLPERYRAPLVLCSLESCTRDEAARQLGIPLGALKSRLEQARQRLRRRLADRGLTLSGALVASVLGEQVAAAAVPAELVTSTVQAATSVMRGGTAEITSAQAAALAHGVLKTMVIARLKMVMGILLAVTCVAAGGGLITLKSLAAHSPAMGWASETPPTEGPSQAVKRPTPLSYHVGEVVRARFFLKNAGKDTLRVAHPAVITQSYYKSIRFTDDKGHEIAVRQAHEVPVPVGWLALKLGPGQEAEVNGLFLSIGNPPAKESVESVFPAQAGHTYSVQYTLPNYGDDKLGNQQTGNYRLTVTPTSAANPKQLTPDELKKYIAWGKPGKNGLQVGVLLLPSKALDPTR